MSEQPEIIVYLVDSKCVDDKYQTEIKIINGSKSITKNDFFAPISLVFDVKIDNTTSNNKLVNPKLAIEKNILDLEFNLLNKNESFTLLIKTEFRPYLKKIKYRIKDIEKINSIDFEKRAYTYQRIENLWLSILILSIILSIDCFSVILKDGKLQELKYFIRYFPLKYSNRDKFINGYINRYKDYNLRIKPNSKFVKYNLKKSLSSKDKFKDIEKLKWAIDRITEIIILYRFRTSFLAFTPIAFLLSLFFLIVNYYYYNLEFLYNNFPIISINQLFVFVIGIFALITIFIPRTMMNLLFLKKGVKGF